MIAVSLGLRLSGTSAKSVQRSSLTSYIASFMAIIAMSSGRAVLRVSKAIKSVHPKRSHLGYFEISMLKHINFLPHYCFEMLRLLA